MSDWKTQATAARDRESSYRSAYSSAEILGDVDALELIFPLIEAATATAKLCEERAAGKGER